MARFYAKFDSGSAGWVSTLDTPSASGSFDRRSIAANSASAAVLRDVLIASRSLLSTDIYADLDSTNRDGSKGIYFPPDSGPFSTNGSTFVSWSTAYTSSVEGIKTPTINDYGVADGINYSKRPTASILSTATTLVGPTNPTDPVGASYTTYINAANAVSAVLNAIQQTGGPNSRLGNFPSRTLHSLWHNPTLDYFAWDDFTPGTPQVYTLYVSGGGTFNDFYYTNPFSCKVGWNTSTYEFSADALAAIYVSASFISSSGVLSKASESFQPAGSDSFQMLIDTDPASGKRGTIGYEWFFQASASFQDPKIKGSYGAIQYDSALMTLYRLYELTLYQKTQGENETLCSSYPATPVTKYVTGNTDPLQTSLDNSGDYDKMYDNTNVSSPAPTSLTNGWYKVPGDSTIVYQIGEADGIIYNRFDCT